MFVIIAKFIAVALGALAISSSYANWRHKRESTTMFLFWFVVWAIAIFVAVYPVIIEKILALTNSSKTGLNTVFGLAIVFLLFISYKLFAKAERVERRLNELISAIAVKEKEKELKK